MAANSGQLVQALIGGGVSPAAAKVIANALANSNTPQFSSSRDLSDQTPADQLRLITPDTRRYQLTNLDYSREQPYQSALDSYPGRYVPETADHPYKDSQPVLPAPPLSSPRILGGPYTEISDAIVDGAQQTQVGIRIAKNSGTHLRANRATNSIDLVPIQINSPQGLVTAEVSEEPDQTSVQLQVRGLSTQTVVQSDGTTVGLQGWPDPAVASTSVWSAWAAANLFPAANLTGAQSALGIGAWIGSNLLPQTSLAGARSVLGLSLTTGTFTPAFEAETGATPTITYNSDRTGVYYRLGPFVFVYARLSCATVGTNSNTSALLCVSGLPFTFANISNYFQPLSIQYSTQLLNWPSQVWGVPNETRIRIGSNDFSEGGTPTRYGTQLFNTSQLKANTGIGFGGVYVTLDL